MEHPRSNRSRNETICPLFLKNNTEEWVNYIIIWPRCCWLLLNLVSKRTRVNSFSATFFWLAVLRHGHCWDNIIRWVCIFLRQMRCDLSMSSRAPFWVVQRTRNNNELRVNSPGNMDIGRYIHIYIYHCTCFMSCSTTDRVYAFGDECAISWAMSSKVF